MPDATLNVSCPSCGRPALLAVTKSSTGAVQYAASCVEHGRATKNWYAAAASITPAVVVKPVSRVKHAAPV